MKIPLSWNLLFLLCTQGTESVLSADVLMRIPLAKESFVHQLAEVKGRVWVATDNGAYRINEGEAELVLSDVVVWAVADIGGEPLLGTSQGIFGFQGSQPMAFRPEIFGRLEVKALCSFDNKVWVATNRGLFWFDPEGDFDPIKVLGSPVTSLSVFREALWFATPTGHRIDPDGEPVPLSDRPIGVTRILEAGGRVWFLTATDRGTPGPPVQLGEEVGRPVFRGYGVASITESLGTVWFGTSDGFFRLEGDKLKAEPLPREQVNAVADLDGEMWVGTTRRIYRRSGEDYIEIPKGEARVRVGGFLRSRDQVWVWTTDGVYRFDEGVNIKAHLETSQRFGRELALGRVIRIRDVRYVTTEGKSAYGESFSGEFEAILAVDREAFDQQVSAGQFSAAAVLERAVPYGRQTLYLLVRDFYGNTQDFEFPAIWVLPASVGLLFGPFARWLLALVVILLARWWIPALGLVIDSCLRCIAARYARWPRVPGGEAGDAEAETKPDAFNSEVTESDSGSQVLTLWGEKLEHLRQEEVIVPSGSSRSFELRKRIEQVMEKIRELGGSVPGNPSGHNRPAA